MEVTISVAGSDAEALARYLGKALYWRSDGAEDDLAINGRLSTASRAKIAETARMVQELDSSGSVTADPATAWALLGECVDFVGDTIWQATDGRDSIEEIEEHMRHLQFFLDQLRKLGAEAVA